MTTTIGRTNPLRGIIINLLVRTTALRLHGLRANVRRPSSSHSTGPSVSRAYSVVSWLSSQVPYLHWKVSKAELVSMSLLVVSG